MGGGVYGQGDGGHGGCGSISIVIWVWVQGGVCGGCKGRWVWGGAYIAGVLAPVMEPAHSQSPAGHCRLRCSQATHCSGGSTLARCGFQ